MKQGEDNVPFLVNVIIHVHKIKKNFNIMII